MLGNNRSNIFSILSHYDPSEEENYLSESFTYLLSKILLKEPDDGIRLLNRIAGRLPVHPFSDRKAMNIVTQKNLGEYGIVDIAIEEAPDTLVLIEVKHDSPLGPRQLARYHKALLETAKENSRLVLLKRHKEIGTEVFLRTDEFHLVTWYEIHKWLNDIEKDDAVLAFLIKEFQTFLEEKNMKLKKISWEYIQEVPALFELRNMLEAAKNEVIPKLHLERTQGWFWVGLYIDKNFFFGLRYDKPLTIVYENNIGKNRHQRFLWTWKTSTFFH